MDAGLLQVSLPIQVCMLAATPNCIRYRTYLVARDKDVIVLFVLYVYITLEGKSVFSFFLCGTCSFSSFLVRCIPHLSAHPLRSVYEA